MAEPKNADPVVQLQRENAELRDRLANIEKLLAHQQPMVAPLQREALREAEYDARKESMGMTCQQRTQLEARRRWKDSKAEYPVKVADVPLILVPARGPEEAKGRYDALCGILGVDAKHKYEIGAPVAIAA